MIILYMVLTDKAILVFLIFQHVQRGIKTLVHHTKERHTHDCGCVALH